MSEDRIGALEFIGFTWRVKEQSSLPWIERYEELKQYKLQKGHCEVPNKYNDNPSLGSWVSNQRQQYKLLKEGKSSTMSKDRIGALEFIGFTWQMKEQSSVPWIEQYEELKQYKLQKGHCEVPNKYNENPSLGTWVKRQRTQYRLLNEGKSSIMSEERIGALEFIGFTWRMQEQRPWIEQYEELKQFNIQQGHCEVPHNYSENTSLGIWVMHQRAQYRLLKDGKSSTMSEYRIGALELIGFTWQMKEHIPWIERYEELKHFRIQKGHCEVPRIYNDNPSLGSWVSTQRTQYKLLKEGKPSNMSEDRFRELEFIGFTWQLKRNNSSFM